MSLRLAIVEDHPALREGLELLLSQEGCVVVGAAGSYGDGRELIERTDPDVSLIDIGLTSDGSGIDLTRDLLADCPTRLVVLYTGHTDPQLVHDGLAAGARGVALKEGSASELVEALSAVAGGACWVDPRIARAARGMRTTPRLSPRERQVLKLLAEGLTNEQVAGELVLSVETVKTHVRNAIAKFGARNRVHAIAIALRSGEIEPGATKAAA